MSAPKICQEPIGYTADPSRATAKMEGHYYCMLPKDHQGIHLIFVPDDPEYWQGVKDEEAEMEAE